MFLKRIILPFGVLILITASIFYLESQKTERDKSADDAAIIPAIRRGLRVPQKEARFERAKEISTPDAFINTDPITIQEIIGKKVILVDFWTYSCINCKRTIPHLNSWHEKYKDKGLAIIGLHTPEFEFEKDLENVKRAVEKFDIKYPVVLDNDYSTWTAYRNQYWPRKYLIDIDGFIVYDRIGEGGYEETEEKIVELLNERSAALNEEAVAKIEMPAKDAERVDFGKIQTPETYLGSARIEHILNLPERDCLQKTCSYVLPKDIPLSRYALDGRWEITPEGAELRGEAGAIAIRFSASKVHLVMGSEDPVPADVYLDGKLVNSLQIWAHDLYTLIDLKGKYETHLLEIRFKKPGVGAYAFTFG